ncbi:MarR family winged helix-turn-helix transcriptional regulator [Kibdelosporangium philippinense]|uniref:MarR family winged helix-turn-helix transcriptional regulator n=1 Tax=Kibdelosporangium philippinense TaxID=211113 RepID=A0ABS8ZNF5_9PSEU|nr:MarR family winged helix-turn-helix transcriptional regulator [Kibdelosporangium philippinense]MCE7009245.1 MarR family winged helix-turn-helix transcriptional regulator [Kibdelosporangium philippinense]
MVDASQVPTEAEIELGSRLGTAMMGLGRQWAAVSSQLSKIGIDKTSMVLLGALKHIGPARSNALAEAVYSDPSTISRQVAGLVKDGLIERRADPADGRASLLAVTDKGRALLDARHRQRSSSLARMLAHWPEEDRERFVELLERFLVDHERAIPTFIEEHAAEMARARGEN